MDRRADEYPDMDAIRNAANAPRLDAFIPSGSSLVDAFRRSMHVDYEKWHDGIGYDLALLERATDTEQRTIVALLVPPSGWRDVEALAAINSDAAQRALVTALHAGNAEVRTAVTNYAPWVGSQSERTDTLIRALRHGKFYEDLSSALDQVEEFHPPEIVDELFRGLLVRPGDIATNFAGMLAFVHGKGDSAFDWAHRPLFLKFNSDDEAERQGAFDALCVLLGIDAAAVRQRITK